MAKYRIRVSVSEQPGMFGTFRGWQTDSIEVESDFTAEKIATDFEADIKAKFRKEQRLPIEDGWVKVGT